MLKNSIVINKIFKFKISTVIYLLFLVSKMLLRFLAQIKRAIHMWWTSSLRCINNILCVVQITYWETLAFKTLKWLRQQVSMDQFFLIFIETFCNVETRTWLTCFLQNSPIKHGKDTRLFSATYHTFKLHSWKRATLD